MWVFCVQKKKKTVKYGKKKSGIAEIFRIPSSFSCNKTHISAKSAVHLPHRSLASGALVIVNVRLIAVK